MKEYWTTENIPGLAGKTAIVTGANSGIGYEAAKALAAKGAKVILACRSVEKGEESAGRILSEYPGSSILVAKLDLGNLESVREFAGNFLKDNLRLDLLINNAGIMMPPYGKTTDGFELQFGTNHLGHFALCGLLLPLLLKTGEPRVVSVSSYMHKSGKINFVDLGSEQSYSKPKAYGQSKLANLLFTYELQRRLEAAGSGCIATAVHPGWASTNLQKYNRILRGLNSVMGQSAANGALPTLRAATGKDVQGGEYYGPGGFMEMKGAPVKVSSNARSHNTDTARKLWEVSEQMTGVIYNF